jgi:hypothetical protein
VMLIQLSKSRFEVHLNCLASIGKQVGQDAPSRTEHKKRAASFGGRPFLKSVCYSKTVRSPHAHHDSCASAYL